MFHVQDDQLGVISGNHFITIQLPEGEMFFQELPKAPENTFFFQGANRMLAFFDQEVSVYSTDELPAEDSPKNIKLDNLFDYLPQPMEKLKFTSYPPPLVKQYRESKLDVSWLSPQTSFEELVFEIELHQPTPVERFDFNLVTSSSALKNSPKAPVLYTSISYINQKNEKCQLFSKRLLLSRSPSFNCSIYTRRILITIHSNSTTNPTSPEIEDFSKDQRAEKNHLHSICFCLYGPKASSQKLDSNRKALLTSSVSHKQLLHICASNEYFSELRNIALELIWLAWNGSHPQEEILKLIENLDLSKFLCLNVIQSGSSTAKLTSRLLLAASQISPEFFKQLNSACIHNLPILVNQTASAGSMNEFFRILNDSWIPQINDSLVLHILQDIGRKMYQNRSSFYALLKTHFDLNRFPLERDIFQIGTVEQIKTVPENEGLSFSFHETSPNSIPSNFSLLLLLYW